MMSIKEEIDLLKQQIEDLKGEKRIVTQHNIMLTTENDIYKLHFQSLKKSNDVLEQSLCRVRTRGEWILDDIKKGENNEN